MAARAASQVLAGLACIAANAACAQEFRPRTEYEQLTERPKPLPLIPANLLGVVSAASPDRLSVTTLSGGSVDVDLEWYEVQSFDPRPGGRFLGIVLQGYEEYGYILIDRAESGSVHHTGTAPSFSPDGRWFAAADLTDGNWSNLEGIALWEVQPKGSLRRFFTDAVPYGADWRVDGWSGACATISALDPQAVTVPEGMEWDEAAKTAPRTIYLLKGDEGGTALHRQVQGERCGDD